MSGSQVAIIVIPIVAFAALGVWLGSVMLAARRPGGKDTGLRPRRNVSGGAFRGDPRQVSPSREETPPEAAAYSGDGEQDVDAAYHGPRGPGEGRHTGPRHDDET